MAVRRKLMTQRKIESMFPIPTAKIEPKSLVVPLSPTSRDQREADIQSSRESALDLARRGSPTPPPAGQEVAFRIWGWRPPVSPVRCRFVSHKVILTDDD